MITNIVKFILLIFFVFRFLNLTGQNKVDTSASFKKNSFYFEIGGAGIICSFNYEKFLFFYNKTGISLTAGYISYPVIISKKLNYKYGTIYPISINLLFNKKKGIIETGIGLTTHYNDYSAWNILTGNTDSYAYWYKFVVFAKFGYRINYKNHFFIKGLFTPWLFYYENYYTQVSGIYWVKQFNPPFIYNFEEKKIIFIPYGSICIGKLF